jgi:hypothetical protein
MNNTLNILHPVKTISIGGETVEVRELRWPEALGFLEELAKQAGQFLTSDGRLTFQADQLSRIIQESGGLVEYLVTKATGKDSGWLNARTPVEVLEVLQAAIELNVSPELFARGKALAGRLQSVFDKRPTGHPSTNSSPNAATS